jgi:quinol-cytochrome oxidoreductase complex cytochrome b subunit
MSDDISGSEIAWSIGLTLFFGFIFSILCYAPKSDLAPLISSLNLPPPWFTIPIYLILHPILGKVLCELVCLLCWSIDKVYNFSSDKKWGNWFKGSKILFSSAWPITGPIGLTITLVALVYGLLFKSLFR